MVGVGMKEVTPDKESNYTYLFKMCLVGGYAAGKTQALLRFTQGNFSEEHLTTIGIDFAVKTVAIESGDLIKLQIWDTAGQERFRTITNSYYRGAHGIAIFFDVTDSESFLSVPNWIQEVQRYSQEDVPIILAGTKSDLEDQRSVSTEEISQLAKESGLDFIELSSKTGDNVHRMFEMMVEKMIFHKNESKKAQNPSMSTMVGPLGKKGKKGKDEKNSMIEIKFESRVKSSTCTIL